MKLIDIHSHRPTGTEDRIEIKVFNTYQEVVETSLLYCISAHPWFLADFDLDEFKTCIRSQRKRELFFAVGEIGLDRKKGIPYPKQMAIFEKIIEFCREIKIPRIVIHSVKTAEDIYKIIHNARYQGQVIFHDYNENEQITQKLLKLNTYFSFGKNFLKENSKANKVFKLIPKERIFFESDDGNDLEICYTKAHELTGQDFKKICFENFQKLLS